MLTIGIYTLLSPFGYGLFALSCACAPRDPVQRAWRLQKLSSGAYRLLHDWLRIMRLADFNHRNALPDLPPRPFVLVANHPTLIDVTSLTAVLGGACTVAKPALFRRRSLHPLLEGAGHLEGPGADPVAGSGLLDLAVERIHQGFPLLIFPEGTRSPRGKLLPFGRAAFEIACRANVPVVSVGIRCEPLWLTKDVPAVKAPARLPVLELSVLATDDPAGVEYDSRRLRETVEQRFRTWHATSPEPRPDFPKDSPCPTPSKTA